jgi:hypothetical protein
MAMAMWRSLLLVMRRLVTPPMTCHMRMQTNNHIIRFISSFINKAKLGITIE